MNTIHNDLLRIMSGMKMMLMYIRAVVDHYVATGELDPAYTEILFDRFSEEAEITSERINSLMKVVNGQ